MPITVKVVSQAVYDEWLTKAKAEYAGLTSPAQSSKIKLALAN